MDKNDIFKSLELDSNLIKPDLIETYKNYLLNHKERYLDLLSQINDIKAGAKILEVGSFPGHFTVLLKELGFKIEGIDIAPERAEKLWKKHNILIHKVNIETQPIPCSSNSFDVIFFTEIIEHLRLNPISVIKELHRILKPNGQLILSTPNITPLMRLQFFIFDIDYLDDPIEEFKKLEWLGHMGHMRLYSFKELKKILEFVGFQISTITYKGKKPQLTKKQKLIFTILNSMGKKYSEDQFKEYIFIISIKK